jgi:hypothetical protein
VVTARTSAQSTSGFWRELLPLLLVLPSLLDTAKPLMDTQKETYRKYLESAGVIDALTRGVHTWQQVPLPCGMVLVARPVLPYDMACRSQPCMHLNDACCEMHFFMYGLLVHVTAPPILAAPAVLVSLYEEPDKPKSAIE